MGLRHGRRPPAPAGGAPGHARSRRSRRPPTSSSQAASATAATSATSAACARRCRGVVRAAASCFPARLRKVTDPLSGFFLVRRDARRPGPPAPARLQDPARDPDPDAGPAGRRGPVRVRGAARGRDEGVRCARASATFASSGTSRLASFARVSAASASSASLGSWSTRCCWRCWRMSQHLLRRGGDARDAGIDALELRPDRAVGLPGPRAPAQPVSHRLAMFFVVNNAALPAAHSAAVRAHERARGPLPDVELALAGSLTVVAVRDRRHLDLGKGAAARGRRPQLRHPGHRHGRLGGRAAGARALRGRRGVRPAPRSTCASRPASPARRGTPATARSHSTATVAQRHVSSTATARSGSNGTHGTDTPTATAHSNGGSHEWQRAQRQRPRLDGTPRRRQRAQDPLHRGPGRLGFAVEIEQAATASRSPASPLLGARPTSSTRTWSSRSCAGRSRAGLRARPRRLLRRRRAGVHDHGQTDTGKTTTTLKMLDRNPYSFVSDDLTIVCPDGRVLAYPKPLTISRHTSRR